MKRILVSKKKQFNVESKDLSTKLSKLIDRELKEIRIHKGYDLLNVKDEDINLIIETIMSETNTDIVANDVETSNTIVSYRPLPLQHDPVSMAAVQCIQLLFPETKVQVKTFTVVEFSEQLLEEEITKIKNFLINKLESVEMDLEEESKEINLHIEDVEIIEGFMHFTKQQLMNMLNTYSLSINFDDLIHIQKYFISEDRDPSITELMMLETYWSDHCRHTTFETEITEVKVEESPLKKDIEASFKEFEENRKRLSPHKKRTLMNLATINFKELREKGQYQDVEVSKEINACSVFVPVNVNNKDIKYLIQFKNETHNHPTEIEPFGGAATCLGGAIRDPLSGRSYIYQAMRVTGAGNPLESIENTMEGKLPQQQISKIAAQGFSSYGNQIGVATTLVEEIIHEKFKAKRMEVGAVVGAVPAEYVVRKEPEEGDIVILIGGRTGRDGIGGASGSSKVQDEKSLTNSTSEVQKGNPVEERKLQRLFSKKEFATLIKRSNDFGAGGVSVAVGELADSIEINLDKVKLKYEGMNGTDIALSESQERMAVVVSASDENTIKRLVKEENLESSTIAKITNSGRLVMIWRGKKIVDVSREFLDTNGSIQSTTAVIESQELYKRTVEGEDLKEQLINNMKAINVASQRGLTQMFDSTIGGSTVLAPYGGKTQLTKTHASVQKVPMRKGDTTDTVTILTQAYNPLVSDASPFLGGAYAIVASVSKVVSYGGDFDSIKFSLQEYFERLNQDPSKWGKPLASLLGATKAMREFEKAAIGGKDSMSGSYKELNVPPTLISFAFATGKADNIISSEFKEEGNNIYVLKHNPMESGLPNFSQLKRNYYTLERDIKSKKVISAWPLVKGGIAEAVMQMAMGNNFGFEIETSYDIFDFNYGTIVVESKEELDENLYTKIGQVTTGEYVVNGVEVSKQEILTEWEKPFAELFPRLSKEQTKMNKVELKEVDAKSFETRFNKTPRVLIPVFPGTNCEFDIERKFAREGAIVKQVVFRNTSPSAISNSLQELSDEINNCDILAFAGGFSAGDEPDGSGKFIATILRNEIVKKSIDKLRERKGLIIGICNGFQALIKSGLLPYGEVAKVKENDPTLFRNTTNSHIARYVRTSVSNTNTPWTNNFKQGEVHAIPISHGEGKFVVNDAELQELVDNNQIAFQYVDNNNKPTMENEFNPNGSTFAIEGITSKDGLILGKMGHSERYEENIAKNIYGNKNQNIFASAVNYFKGDE